MLFYDKNHYCGVKAMAKGDHLYVEGLFDHHGIDCGDSTVIHYDASFKGGIGEIVRVSKSEFAKGKSIRIKKYATNYSPDEIVTGAEQRLGERSYHPIHNNCEHFVYWCTTGESECYQLDRAMAGGAGALGVGAYLATTQVAARGILGLIGVTTGLPLVTVAGGAIVTGLAIHQALKRVGDWEDE
jgi:hypothetical protein